MTRRTNSLLFAALVALLWVVGCIPEGSDGPSFGPPDDSLTPTEYGIVLGTPQARLAFPGGTLCVTSDDCSQSQVCRLDEHLAYRCTEGSLVREGPRGPQNQPPPPPGLLEGEALTGGGQ